MDVLYMAIYVWIGLYLIIEPEFLEKIIQYYVQYVIHLKIRRQVLNI